MPDDDQGGFGPRDSRPAGASPAPAHAASTLQLIVRSPLGKQLLGALGGIAILFLLQAVYVASMKATGRALDRHGSENAGDPAIEDAHPPASHQTVGFEPAPRLLQRMH